MKLVKISDLFNISYGNGLELNRLSDVNPEFNFVSRTSKNNGVSSKVDLINDATINLSGTITVSLGGSVLESFLQHKPFYTGYHIYVLSSKVEMSDNQKLYYCCCIRANKYRYNYGRQANRTLKDILVPDPSEIPSWVSDIDLSMYDDIKQSHTESPTQPLNTNNWEYYKLSDLFSICKGTQITKQNMVIGKTPYITATSNNNGTNDYVEDDNQFNSNMITISSNGSIGEAFYQSEPFCASSDVNVLEPKFQLNKYIALFICTVIRQEKYRFNYGRKWTKTKMEQSKIKLPTKEGQPDWQFMEQYIKSLPYSGSI